MVSIRPMSSPMTAPSDESIGWEGGDETRELSADSKSASWVRGCFQMRLWKKRGDCLDERERISGGGMTSPGWPLQLQKASFPIGKVRGPNSVERRTGANLIEESGRGVSVISL